MRKTLLNAKSLNTIQITAVIVKIQVSLVQLLKKVNLDFSVKLILATLLTVFHNIIPINQDGLPYVMITLTITLNLLCKVISLLLDIQTVRLLLKVWIQLIKMITICLWLKVTWFIQVHVLVLKLVILIVLLHLFKLLTALIVKIQVLFVVTSILLINKLVISLLTNLLKEQTVLLLVSSLFILKDSDGVLSVTMLSKVILLLS